MIYDLAGRRTKRTMNNFTETDTAYDAASRVILLEQKNAAFTFDRRDYGYNTVNNRTYEQRDNALGDAYAYDATRQVTGVQYDATTPDLTPTAPARTVAYAFDATGNRTSGQTTQSRPTPLPLQNSEHPSKNFNRNRFLF